MWYVIVLLIVALAGLAGGFLIYRNNAKKLQEKEKALRGAADALK